MQEKHFETLDGLRGIAAIAVFAFHMLELMYRPQKNPLWHAALAVDFFFCLSGYVVSHAYDTRRALFPSRGEQLTVRSFALKRLIRLHPLVILGLVWVTITFLLNPFVGDAHSLAKIGFDRLAANIVLGLLLIPAPAILWTLTHSLNGPAWSLAQEYLANIAYGLFGHRVGKRALSAIVVVSAGVLLFVAVSNNTIILGPSWPSIWAAPVRVAASFSLGMLLCRCELRWRIPHAFPILSLLLIATMASPKLPIGNGWFEWLIAMAAFPLLVIAGAGHHAVSGFWGPYCRMSGRLSYPLYMLHYPFALYFANWNSSYKPAPAVMWMAFAGSLLCGLLFSWAVMRWVDEPLRAWLSRAARRGSLHSTASVAPR